MEEQSAVTREMSAGMHTTARAVERISASVSSISDAVNDVARAVETTKGAARVLAR